MKVINRLSNITQLLLSNNQIMGQLESRASVDETKHVVWSVVCSIEGHNEENADSMRGVAKFNEFKNTILM